MKTLFLYQDPAYRALVESVGKRPNALLIMATGCGKTVVAAAFVRWWLKRKRRPILFLVHLWEAIDQAVAEFRDALGDDVNIQVLDGAQRIDPKAKIVLSTFQTMRGRYTKIPKDTFGMVVVDECHRSKADTYEPIVEHFTPVLRFGMTATEERMDGRDIGELFGDPVYEYPLYRALAENAIASVEYRVLVDNISQTALRRIEEKLGAGDRSITRAMIDREVFLAERLDVIAETIRQEQKKRGQTIIFCNSRRHANAVAAHFPGAVPLYSGLPQGVLQDRFRDFKAGTIKTLIVVDKFNEAIDVPCADLIVFLRATESKTIWLQQLGRGLRKAQGKDNVLVLDFVANCDRVRIVGQLASAVRGHLGIIVSGLPEIHRTGLDFVFETQVRDILDVLERLEHELYPTIEEAMVALQRMNPVPRTKDEYTKSYRQDPRLPSQPGTFYKGRGWVSWGDFLGTPAKKFYSSYAAASRAAKTLCISKQSEYKIRYREDPRLPSNPNSFYSEWVDWIDFLGKTVPYGAIEEAVAAVQKLDPVPRSRNEYLRGYDQDPRLPSEPNKIYRECGWISWPRFLGTEGMPRRKRPGQRS